MEALIWQHDSIDGVDHGESCAAFASLTLELGAQVVGQQSWVTGGTTYPWPLHKWADVRVDPNPASPGIISVVQDARRITAGTRWATATSRCPGDWVLFDGHVEVVTGYSGGVLHTIGGDSLPNLSVNAHDFAGSLARPGRHRIRQQRRVAQRGEPAGGGPTAGAPAQAARRRRPAPRRRPALRGRRALRRKRRRPESRAGPSGAVTASAGGAAIPGRSRRRCPRAGLAQRDGEGVRPGGRHSGRSRAPVRHGEHGARCRRTCRARAR